MTNQQILEHSITKAIDSGWQPLVGIDNEHVTPEIKEKRVIFGYVHDDEATVTDIAEYSSYGIVFDHDFAKALWGEDWAFFTEGQSGDTLPSGNYVNWKGHLANMVVADDPIKYLGENI